MFKYLRFKILELISKRLTPKFYEGILKRYLDAILYPTSIENIYRPSINRIMKNYPLFQNKNLIGAEIGVHYGRNALNLLSNLNIKKLYLIDIWDCNSLCYSSIKAYKSVRRLFLTDNKVTIMRGYSVNVVRAFQDESLDFVYIDADHSYDHVYQDVKLWDKKVRENGIVSGHDVNQMEVYKAVNDYCNENQLIMKIEMPDWYYYKRRD